MQKFDFKNFVTHIVENSKIQNQLVKKQFKKGELVFSQGDVCRDVFIILSGLIKLFFNTRDGKEWIKSFIADRGLLGSRISQTLNQASAFSAICLEDTEVYCLPYETLTQLCFNDMKLAQDMFYFNQWLGVKKEIREYQLLCLSPEEAYEEFKKTNPGLIERITQVDIARYLGITPVALSRIKKRLKS